MSTLDECRKIVFENSGQLTLRQLIDRVVEEVDFLDDMPLVFYDFCGFVPTKPLSWRGNWRELALGYAKGYGSTMMLGDEFVEMLEGCIGKSFDCYKFPGYSIGNVVIREDAPVWVSNLGEQYYVAVTGVVNDGHNLFLQTKSVDPFDETVYEEE